MAVVSKPGCSPGMVALGQSASKDLPRVAEVWHKPQVGSFWGCRNYISGGSDFKADSGSL